MAGPDAIGNAGTDIEKAETMRGGDLLGTPGVQPLPPADRGHDAEQQRPRTRVVDPDRQQHGFDLILEPAAETGPNDGALAAGLRRLVPEAPGADRAMGRLDRLFSSSRKGRRS